MKFNLGAETDLSFPQKEWGKLVESLIDDMREKLAASDLADTGWTFNYVPILMSPANSDLFPARTRCWPSKQMMNCSPQLDHARYMAGNAAVRESILYEGLLHDGLILFERARFSEKQKDVFASLIQPRLNTLAESAN